MNPAPLGLPAERLPSCANSLPWSLGSIFVHLASKRHVRTNAKIVPAKATVPKSIPLKKYPYLYKSSE